MEKSKIDWCNSTWNPVTGCLHECEYCYARKIAERFGEKQKYANIFEEDNPVKGADNRIQPYPHSFSPTLHRYRLSDYIDKKGRNIFVCSMADLFGNWVPDAWIEEVFEACRRAPQHNYMFLTKNPNRYLELQDKGKIIQKDNMWYGASVTDEKSLQKVADALGNISCDTKTFLSVEPILGDITLTETWNDCVTSAYMDWVIIGAETGRRKDKIIPDRSWIRSIAFDCGEESWKKIPVFMKSSLAEIWGEPLIQEFPEGLRDMEESK